MSVLVDLRNAVDTYETANCKTEIVNFKITGGGGTVLNKGETFEFKVKVTNEGPLDMKNVKVRALGTMYADVTLGAGVFGSSAVSASFALDAYQAHTTGAFKGKAKAVTSGSKVIVKAQIDSWDASLDYILVDKSGAGTPEGTWSTDIKPD